MNISVRSWHYRLLRYFGVSDHNMPRSLCGYFWKLVALCAAHFALRVAIAWIFIVAPLFAFLTGYVELAVPAILLLSLAGCLFVFAGVCFLIDSIAQHSRRAEPGLVRSYIQANKRKVCPLITYVE